MRTVLTWGAAALFVLAMAYMLFFDPPASLGTGGALEGAPGALSAESRRDILYGLRDGKIVRVEAEHAPGADASEPRRLLDEMRGFGPLPKYAKEKLLKLYSKRLRQLQARLAEPREGTDVGDVLAQASDVAMLEETRACYAAVDSGEAFFAEYKVLPEIDGYRLLAVQSQTMVVDEEGNVVQDAESYAGDVSKLLKRSLPVIVPLRLEEGSSLSAAMRFRRDLQLEVVKERVDQFNALAYEERKRLWDDHHATRQALIDLGLPTSRLSRRQRA